MTGLLAGLEEVDWSELSHAYGPATDVPDLLRAFAFGSHQEREEAREAWSGSIIHQGTYSSAAVAVVPFLAEIILAPSVPDRFDLINEVQWIASGWLQQLRRWRPKPVFENFTPPQKACFDEVYVRGAYEETLRHGEAFCTLMLSGDLSDEDAIALAILMSVFADRFELALSALFDAFDSEHRPHVRAMQLFAMKELVANCQLRTPVPVATHQAVIARFSSVAWGDENHTSQERVAATIGLLELGDDAESDALFELMYQLTKLEPDAFCIEGHPYLGDLLWIVYAALDRKATIQREWIQRCLQQSDSQILKTGISFAELHCERYRQGPSVFVPILSRLLERSSDEVREKILWALSAAGERGLAELEHLANVAADNEAADRLQSFQSIWKSYAVSSIELSASDSGAQGQLDIVKKQLNSDNPGRRVAAIAQFLQLTQDPDRTVQLVLDNWSMDFIAIPLLELVGACGSAAAHLVPDLNSLIHGDERCVYAGWTGGVCKLDEAIVEAARNALSKMDGPKPRPDD